MPADLLALAPHLTDRDLMIASWLVRHDVLTTEQIAQAFFTSPITARHRLVQLLRLHWLSRFHRPLPGGGFTPWQWVIGPLGAAWHAAANGEDPPTLTALRRRWARLAASPTLNHRLGCHQFFIDLHSPGRAGTSGARLQWWLSANESAEAFLQRIHPDGAGRYGTVRFFAEHDTGSESISQLVQKLDAYASLRADGGPGWPVLFHLPTERREVLVHLALDRARLPVPLATCVHGQPPTGQVWRLAQAGPQRRHLADLPCDPATNTIYGAGL
ncbi:MAG: replication-relaxation family protein [Hamadaea sp.]|nr:replication-relaxation family protein [Hamadaea sp.]